jgi:hypothetical protein
MDKLLIDARRNVLLVRKSSAEEKAGVHKTINPSVLVVPSYWY